MSENAPRPSATPRDTKPPTESTSVTTAPATGSWVVLSVSVPRTRCACPRDSATHSARAAPPTCLRTRLRERAHTVDQTTDLIVARVAAAPNAHEAVGH